MGIIIQLKAEARSAARTTPGTGLASPDSWLLRMLGLTSGTIAGVAVDEFSAMNLSTFWACVRNIAEDVAKLPVGVYRDGADRRSELRDEPLVFLMNRAPNEDSIPIAFREVLTAHAEVWGRGVAEIEWFGNGRPAALWPIQPNRVVIERGSDQRIHFRVHSPRTDREVTLRDEDVIHIHGLGWDGITGYSVIQKARESLGLTAATERYGASFFGNNATPSGVLMHPGKVRDGGVQLKKSWNEAHQGPGKARGTAILEEGMKYEQIGIPPEDSQFLQTRQFQVIEICRWFRMPPHKVADLTRGTFANLEQSATEYVTDCLMPWVIRWEQELQRKFYGAADPRYVRFNVSALVRGDMESRYRAHAIARQWGWSCADDVRRLEDEDPLPNKQGEIYLVPANMVPADKVAAIADATIEGKKAPPAGPNSQGDPPPANPENGNQNRSKPDPEIMRVPDLATFARILQGQKSHLTETLSRSLRIEADKVSRNAKRKDFAAWSEEFYREHRDHVRGSVFPVAEAFASIAVASGRLDLDAAKLAAGIADRCIRSSREQLAGPAEGMLDRLSDPARIEALADAELAALTQTITAGAQP